LEPAPGLEGTGLPRFGGVFMDVPTRIHENAPEARQARPFQTRNGF